MKHADFYLLNQDEKENCYRLACQVVYKAWKEEGKSVYIYCQEESQAKIVDDMLWTFKDISFVPHQIMTEPLKSNLIKVGIGYHGIAETSFAGQILLNLSQTAPDFFNDYSHIIEILSQEPTERANGRVKYKTYKQANYECVTHQNE